MRFKRVLSLLALLGSVVGCPTIAWGSMVTDQLIADGTSASSPRVIWQGQHALVAFYDYQGMLTILDPQNPATVRKISSQGQPAVVNSWIDLSGKGTHVFAIWRPKFAQGEHQGDKIILFSASHDSGANFSSPLRLNTHGGAFHPRPLVRGNEKLLYLTWADERLRPEGIYFNRSIDGGKSWLQTELRMDRLDKLGQQAGKPEDGTKPAPLAFDPFMAAEGSLVWLGWSELGVEPPYDRNIIKLRISKDAGATWSEPRNLPTPAARTFNVTLLRTRDGNVAAFYYAQRGGILVIRSEDDGATWSEPQLLGGTVEVGGQRFKVAQNSRGTLCLTWEGPNRLRGKKADVFITCSQNFGKSWPEQPTRLDTNTPWLTHSLAPRMAMDDDNNIVAVWQDYRHVRPNVYMRYSRDNGKNWTEQDIRLDLDPGQYQSTFPWVEAAGRGRFLVVWRTKIKDGLNNIHKLSYAAFTLSGVSEPDKHFPVLQPRQEQPLSMADKQSRRERLQQRISEYWQALVDGDYAKAFSLMDPFYRAGANMMTFGGPLSRIRYFNYQIPLNDITLAGNIATLQMRITMEVPMFVVQGIQTSIPKHQVELPEKWVWVDGDWFRVFENQGNNFLPP